MKRIILVVVVLLFVIVGVAYADSWLPKGVSHWTDECGYTCYVFPDGSGECYPCLEGGCDEEITTTPTPVATDTPTDPKDSCNRGIGNGSEGCDPGNSSGKGKGGGRDAGEDRNENKKDKKK